MPWMLLAGGGTLLVTSILLVTLIQIRGGLFQCLSILIAAHAVIVTQCILLSELGAFSSQGFGAAQILILILVVALWCYRKRPRLIVEIPSFQIESGWGLLVALSSAIAVLIMIYALIAPYYISNYVHDALAYQLPRAYFWLELGTARHFHTADFRMTEFPPNSSFFYAWIMAFDGAGSAWLHLPQWIGGVMLGLATAALARLFGASRLSAVSCSIVVAFFPIAAVQLGTSQNDLSTAGMSLATLAFALRAASSNFKEQEAFNAAIYAGIAFGLVMGAKLTPFFVAPFWAAAVLVMAFAHNDFSTTLKKLGVLGGAVTVGFIAFAGYNIALNLAEFGHPISSVKTDELLATNFHEFNVDPLTNFVRLVYQLLDWPGIDRQYVPLPHAIANTFSLDFLPRMQLAALYGLRDLTGIDFFSGTAKSALISIRGAPPSGTDSGFGPVGFLFFLLSLPAVAYCFGKWFKTKNYSYLTAAILLLTIWIFVFLIGASRPWTTHKPRYFLIVMPTAVALILPYLWQRRVWRYSLVAPSIVLSLWIGLSVIWAGHDGLRVADYVQKTARAGHGPIYHQWGGLQAGEIEQLAQAVPAGSVIGVDTKIDVPLFKLFGELEDLHFRPMTARQIDDGMAAGTVAAALIASSPKHSAEAIPLLNDPEVFLLVHDPKKTLRQEAALMGLTIQSNDEHWQIETSPGMATTFTGSIYGYWARDRFKIILPVALFPNDWSQVSVELELEEPAPTGFAALAQCGDRLYAFRKPKAELSSLARSDTATFCGPRKRMPIVVSGKFMRFTWTRDCLQEENPVFAEIALEREKNAPETVRVLVLRISGVVKAQSALKN